MHRARLVGAISLVAVICFPVPGAVAEEGGYAPTFASPHADPIAISADGQLLYVANTAADTLDVVDANSGEIAARVRVGVDPVGVAVRPDGKEVWVANHVSDSVSVVDADASSSTYHQVIATVQAFDASGLATTFDEPVGVAFASDTKAYVTLSSVNDVAVVDVATRVVTKRLFITAQEPRALRVRGGRLYVIPFESANQTQLSGCLDESMIDNDRCTFSFIEHVVVNNNVLSYDYLSDIIRDPNLPDRDLFVFDTSTDELIAQVETIGTLLYGLAVDSAGKVFIAMTEARNDANGRAGTLQHGLLELENRAFLNQIGVVDCSGASCGAPGLIELEPLPPVDPAPGTALATPYAIQVSGDDKTLVLTAAGSNRLFTVDAQSGEVLGRVSVGGIPRGLVLLSDESGAPAKAWVFNEGVSSVSFVDVSDPANPQVTHTTQLEDLTHPDVREGRLAFNNAAASTSETFSCESCHPDAHTDQLLWILGGPRCVHPGCLQIQARSTMPARGLRDTLPLHWDGVPADPFGGINGEVVIPELAVEPNCTTEHSCFRHLVDGSLGSTMCNLDACESNDAGLPGRLSEAERDALAIFLRSVPVPPARERRIDDDLTALAEKGFQDFFYNEGNRQACGTPGTCHAQPLWNGTNTPGTGFDAPTFRSLPDRWLILPQGRTLIFDLLQLATDVGSNPVPFDAALGHDELSMWTMTFGTEEQPANNRAGFGIGPFPSWQMFLEGSMGFPGSFGRQITLNQETASGDARPGAAALLAVMERASAFGVIELSGEGVHTGDVSSVSYVFVDGTYREEPGDVARSRDELLDAAAAGELVVTFTGRLGPNVDTDHPQPLLWNVRDPNVGFRHDYPILPEENPMQLLGRHIAAGATIFLNGRRVGGDVTCASAGELPDCEFEQITVRLDEIPPAGNHLLQVANPGGLMSNEFLLFSNQEGQRTGLQVSPDHKRTLISKDLEGERWAIVWNADDGSVTGNVFRPDGSDPAFLWCEAVASIAEGMLRFSCNGADPCTGGSCSNDGWSFISEVELPAAFFQPGENGEQTDAEVAEAAENGASGLRTSPDGKRTLVSKDALGQRWAITLNDDGSVTGNVYNPDGSPPQFLWCSASGEEPDPQADALKFDCFGADPCVGGECFAADWTLIGPVEVPDSFFLP